MLDFLKKLGKGFSSKWNKLIGTLFKPLEQEAGRNPRTPRQLTRGSLITFNYMNWIHDPYPLVIVTDLIPGNRVRGINLHYLTFPYIKLLLDRAKGNTAFSYQNVMDQEYIKNAFRHYKWNSIRQVKVLDLDFVLTVMAQVRSIDPGEVQKIREAVQAQIDRQVNVKASEVQPEEVMGQVNVPSRFSGTQPIGTTLGQTPNNSQFQPQGGIDINDFETET